MHSIAICDISSDREAVCPAKPKPFSADGWLPIKGHTTRRQVPILPPFLPSSLFVFQVSDHSDRFRFSTRLRHSLLSFIFVLPSLSAIFHDAFYFDRPRCGPCLLSPCHRGPCSVRLFHLYPHARVSITFQSRLRRSGIHSFGAGACACQCGHEGGTRLLCGHHRLDRWKGRNERRSREQHRRQRVSCPPLPS
jgi:hypothetical protein